MSVCSPPDLSAGDATISGYYLETPATTLDNIWVLWLGAEQRGKDKDVIRPGAGGSLPVRRRKAATTRDLYMRVSGLVNRTGVPYANPYNGMQKNLDWIQKSIVDPVGGDGTRPLVLWLPDGTTQTEPIIVQGMEIEEMHPKARQAKIVIEIVIPSGSIF